MKFRNIKIGRKLLIGFASILLVAMVIGYIGYVGMHSIERQQDEISGVRLPSVHSLSIIDEAQTAVEASENALLASNITPELIKMAYERIDSAKLRADKAWKVYELLPQSDEEAKVWKEFVIAWNDWWKHHEKIMELAKKYNAEKTVQSYNTLSYNALTAEEAPYNKAENLLMELIKINNKIAEDANLEAEIVSRLAELTLVIALIIGLIVSIVLGQIGRAHV